MYDRNLDAMFCSLQIHYYMDLRNKVSKELIHTPVEPLKNVEEFFQSIRTIWEASEPCKRLRSILGSKSGHTVHKIVAFACGSMAYSCSHQDRSARRTAYQHALLLTLQDIFSSQNPIKCFAQDPIYTEVDEYILKRHEIAVVDDPKAFLEVDTSTIVFTVAPNLPVKQIVTDLTKPVAMIWNKITEKDHELSAHGKVEGRPACHTRRNVPQVHKRPLPRQ